MSIDENKLIEELESMPYIHGRYDHENANPSFINGITTWHEVVLRKIKEQPKTCDWILCKKQLPEEKINPITQNYYVYPVIFEAEDVIDIRYYSFGKGHWYNGSQIMDDYVSAWYQLPEPIALIKKSG